MKEIYMECTLAVIAETDPIRIQTLLPQMNPDFQLKRTQSGVNYIVKLHI
jgi:hypothetical protein